MPNWNQLLDEINAADCIHQGYSVDGRRSYPLEVKYRTIFSPNTSLTNTIRNERNI